MSSLTILIELSLALFSHRNIDVNFDFLLVFIARCVFSSLTENFS